MTKKTTRDVLGTQNGFLPSKKCKQKQTKNTYKKKANGAQLYLFTVVRLFAFKNKPQELRSERHRRKFKCKKSIKMV